MFSHAQFAQNMQPLTFCRDFSSGGSAARRRHNILNEPTLQLQLIDPNKMHTFFPIIGIFQSVSRNVRCGTLKQNLWELSHNTG